MLEETLVVWGGEFGRTPIQENRGGNAGNCAGRDHNTNSFSICGWLVPVKRMDFPKVKLTN